MTFSHFWKILGLIGFIPMGFSPYIYSLMNPREMTRVLYYLMGVSPLIGISLSIMCFGLLLNNDTNIRRHDKKYLKKKESP